MQEDNKVRNVELAYLGLCLKGVQPKENEKLHDKKCKKMSEKNETNGKQLKCYAIMATAQGGVRPAMVLTDERDAYDMCAALEAAGAVLTEKVSYEVVETILRH